MNKIRIGTRGSKLALKQAFLVQEALRQTDGAIDTEIVVVHTIGDKVQDRPLAEIGDKGVFASELEQALLNGQIDIAVHSAKDLPMALAEGLSIAAVLPRGDVRDVLVIPEGGRIPLPVGREQETEKSLEKDSEMLTAAKSPDKGIETAEAANVSDRRFVIGSGSRRRQQQAGQIWKNVVCENIRGNVDTRLRKLKDGSSDGTVYDGIILAKAGLDRLGIGSEREEGLKFYPLPPEQFLPAACQGIIAVEALQDSDVAMLCREITDAETELCFRVEREVLVRLAADCSESVAAWCRQEEDSLILDVMYARNRQQLVSAAEVREGLAMAREAAKIVAGIESS
ncbi:MAG: hydroxymethylbilane synthase [Lachnospiraceae bacterium]|nr:hydroxymethylbilane synthase [Lachnospiraceae bacterium]